jgi:hypothetical protein
MTLIPYYGVRAFFYALLFLCIDKRDEYQLILYIQVPSNGKLSCSSSLQNLFYVTNQSFKASQFLAGGVVSGASSKVFCFLE